MPEGIEVYKLGLKLKFLEGRSISKISFVDRSSTRFDFQDLTLPNTVLEVFTHGKVMYWKFSQGYLKFNFALTGGFSFKQKKDSRLQFFFDEQTIYYNDSRNFGKISWSDGKLKGTDLFSLTEEQNIVFPDKILTNILISQDYISGIGNYLKCEILHYAGLYPKKNIHNLTNTERIKLWNSILWARDYFSQTIPQDDLSFDLKINPFLVYRQKICSHGQKVSVDKFSDGRKTYWSEFCQK